MSKDNPQLDDACEVCGERRDEHGDKQHKFSYDGQLVQIDPPKAAPRSLPPQVRGGSDPQQKAFLRLIERLAQKGMLTGDDMLYVFGGIVAPDRGQPEEGTAKDNGTTVT